MALLYDHKSLSALRQDELDQAIKKHVMFKTGRVGGARAILTHRDLTGLDFRSSDLAGADFSGSLFYQANLGGCNLDGAVFFVANLQKANLTNASLMRADLRGCNLAGANLSGTNLVSVDMREGAMATKDRRGNINLMLQTGAEGDVSRKAAGGYFTEYVDASEALFIDARLNRAFLRGADFSGAVLEGADLTLAQMQGAKFVNAVLLNTRLDGVELSEVNLQGALRDELQGLSLDDSAQSFPALAEAHKAWVESHGARGARLDLTRYDLRAGGVDFSQGLFPMLKARQAIFYRMNFEGAEIQAADLRDGDFRLAIFTRADLRGTDFSGSLMAHAQCDGANLGPLTFAGGRQRRVDMSRCGLRHASFQRADLSHVDFREADLSYADLRGANLTGADLTGALTEGMQS